MADHLPGFIHVLNLAKLVLSGIRVTRSLVLYVCFVDYCLSFCTFFPFAHCIVILLRYTDSDYPVGIFKLFLWRFYGFTGIKRYAFLE